MSVKDMSFFFLEAPWCRVGDSMCLIVLFRSALAANDTASLPPHSSIFLVVGESVLRR